MDWIQAISIIATVLGVFVYLGSKIDSLQKSIHEDMKDFHGRLCSIEERNKK